MKKINIGDVAVTDAACTNPYTYRGPLYSGAQRRRALMIFEHGWPIPGVQLWHAPANGGARKITADEVAW